MPRHLITTCLQSGDSFPVSVRAAREGHQATALLHIGDLTALVSDPAVLDTLAAAVAEARDRLTAEVTDQTPPPMVAEPVGDTGLFLHPLPVGQV